MPRLRTAAGSLAKQPANCYRQAEISDEESGNDRESSHDAFRTSAGSAHGHQGNWRRCRGGRDWRDAGAGRDRGAHRRRRDLEQRILDQKGRHPLVDVPQADRRAEGRRAGAAGGVLCPWLLGDLAGVRSQRPRQGRIFRHERVRPLRVRLLDHGSRKLRQVRPHLRQCRYRQRRRGSEGRGRTHHARDRPEEIPFRRQVLRRAARRRLCHGGARARRPAGVRRLHLQGRGIADADQTRRAAGLLSVRTTCASATAR